VKQSAELNRIGRNVFDTHSVSELDGVRAGLRSIMDGVPRDRDAQLEYGYQMYLEEFTECPKEQEFLSIRAMLEHHCKKPKKLAGHDLGVLLEQQLSVEQLMESLGMKGKAVLPFMNRVMHTQAWPVWTSGLSTCLIQSQLLTANKADLAGSPLGNTWKPARLRPHQIAGIHAVLRIMSQAAPRGVLIADEVGVGKTCQAAGVLAMMIHATERPDHRLPLGQLPVLPGPTVIVCPKSLIFNWQCELNVWMTGVEVFVYDVPEPARPIFFDHNSAWQQSKTPLHRRVILVSETTLGADAAAALSSAGRTKSAKAYKLKAGAENKCDLFGQFHVAGCLGLIIIDEAHNYRSRRRNYDGTSFLANRAVGVIALTATPVFTHPSVCAAQHMASCC
jgi:hypothetical protein